MVIDFSFFKENINIGQLDTPPVRELVQNYIKRFEKEFLIKWLGKELAEDYIENWEQSNYSDLDKILVDRDFKISPIANYIWFKYAKYTFNLHQGVGMVNPNAENATKVDPEERMVWVWNEMVDWICDKHKEINALDIENYKYRDRGSICFDGCGCGNFAPFQKINRFGI